MPDVTPSAPGGAYHESADRSAAIRFRRALTLTLMTLVVPGSAQLVCGNKRVGRVAVRIWLSLVALTILVGLVALLSRSTLLDLFTDATVLTLGRWALLLLALGWAGLLIDAWRLGAPLELTRRHRTIVAGLNGVMCLLVAGTLVFAANLVAVQSSFLGTVFASEEVNGPAEGRYNVLLLGADSGKDRSGLRPDSINVASIDKETGRTVLVGLPRNLEDVPFPKGSVMAKQFPQGFNCDDSCYLNGVNTWANDHADLFDSKQPGIDATIGAVEEITGLDISYYALINMHGFSKLVDAVGGVTMEVKERTAIGGIGSPIRGWIEKGKQHLSGDETTWYARSRVLNDDFSRMGRQKCVMTAMLQQLSPRKVLMNAEGIAESSKGLFSTSIPQSDVGTFIDLALKAKSQRISSVSLVPPQVYTGNPDYPKIRRMVHTAVAKSEGTYSTNGLRNASLPVVKAPSGEDDADDPRKANESDDLGTAC